MVTRTDSYEYNKFHVRYKTLSAIRRVCRYWNRVAVNLSRLWTRVAIDATRQRIPAPHYVQDWLQRSGDQMPIQILLALPNGNNSSSNRSGHLNAIFDLLALYMPRWEELWFYSEVGLEFFPRNLSMARNLTKLTIDAGFLDEGAVKELEPGFKVFPGALRDVDLSVVTFDWIHSWLVQCEVDLDRLERLQMSYEGWMQGVLDLLDQSQDTLVSAQIHAEGQWSLYDDYHTFSSNTERISMSRLRSIHLDIWDANLDIFNYLHTGNLMFLDVSVHWSNIESPEARDMTPLLEFIDRGPPVLELCRVRIEKYRSYWPRVFFRSQILAQLHTYEICGVQLSADVRQAVLSSASRAIRNRLTYVREDTPGYCTVGWARFARGNPFPL
ncbi:hypothetical protein AN958_03378 [Leucoagaricus sp. SymC.cos]|nr:hypothetical protein AN958_03378 [Leucoagaricus sp. SymC.cos]